MATAARRHSRTKSFRVAVGSAADDADVRRLLREHPLRGRISLSFEREPDASVAAGIDGDVHQTVVARDPQTGALAGIASRAERVVFVNGAAARLGYLGQLRVASGVRRLRSLIDDGFAGLRELHETGGVPAYLVSLVGDNDAARRLLIDRRSGAGPRFVPAGRLATLVLPARRAGSRSAYRRAVSEPADAGASGVAVRVASAADLHDIADCLQRNLRRFQFAPVWDADTLRSPGRMRGLAIGDFVVAERGGRVVGCAALWDQRAFRQVVVRGYDATLGRWRWLVNAAAPWLGVPRLPPVGRQLSFAYVSHLAADEAGLDVVASLVSAVRERARRAGLEYVVAAAPAGHRLDAAIAALGRHRRYASDLYLASWPDGDDFVRSVDARPSQPEVAIL